MFEEFYLNIELTDAEIFFLAKELDLNQIIGLGFDYESMSKEMKNAIKQESYDLFEKQQALQMDFSGNTIVADSYASVIKSFEYPAYCRIVQQVDAEKKESYMRKVYSDNGEWIALDYIAENVCHVYKLPDANNANSFLFGNINIDAQNEPSEQQIVFSSIAKLYDNASKLFVVTEYILKGNSYEAVQKIYANLINKGWYIVDLSSTETSVILNPVTELVKID